VNRDTNRESQTIRDDSRDSQRLRYIFIIRIENILNHIESYDSNRESYNVNITGEKSIFIGKWSSDGFDG
jgi:hypothetical protein